jgi:hypothetical protein
MIGPIYYVTEIVNKIIKQGQAFCINENKKCCRDRPWNFRNLTLRIILHETKLIVFFLLLELNRFKFFPATFLQGWA